MNHKEWLDNLKVGDSVKISRGIYGFSIKKIDRITKCYFIIGEKKYRKDNGSLAGDSPAWNFLSISQITDEDILKIKRNKLKEQFDNTYNQLSHYQIDEINKLLSHIPTKVNENEFL